MRSETHSESDLLFPTCTRGEEESQMKEVRKWIVNAGEKNAFLDGDEEKYGKREGSISREKNCGGILAL